MEKNSKYDKDIQEAFELLDGNKDGLISIEELGNTVRLLNPRIKDADVRDVLGELKPELNFDIFNALWKAKLKEGTEIENEYETLFEYFDKDRNGLIDARDLMEGLNSIGSKITPEEADEMVQEADLDGDRMIDIEEFQRMINSII